MQIRYAYNIAPPAFADGDFAALYTQRRRDSVFACAYQAPDGTLYALRDHLGIAPLYYRFTADGVRFAACLSDLIVPGDRIDPAGARTYICFGTPRLAPLIAGIQIVPPGSVIRIDPATQRSETVYHYVLQPRRIPTRTRFDALVDELDSLLQQATQRLVRHDRIGLYLSGGVDSVVTGLYLRQAGVSVHAYTSAPWGRTGAELPFVAINARALAPESHVIDYLESDAYSGLLDAMSGLYGGPHGTSTALGVASLWVNTAIGEERQIVYGQNSDTVFCSAAPQYIPFFMRNMPAVLRRRAHPRLGGPTLDADYLSFARGYAGDVAALNMPPVPPGYQAAQRLIHLALFAATTPNESEVLAGPAIRRGILVGDPFSDVDVAEFALGLPLRHRLRFSRRSPLRVALDKRLLHAIALRHVPKELVYRKKAFAVSLERDARTQEIVAALPTALVGTPLLDLPQRFAAETLIRWCKQAGLALG